jgi:hypothetical protein
MAANTVGTGARSFRPPLSDAVLDSHDFFSLYPLDGGGMFVFRNLADPLDDEGVARKLMRGGLLRPWGKPPAVNFSALDRWRSVEQSCWLNRFYFAAALGRVYRRTGDERIARMLKGIVLHFIESCPAPQGVQAIGAHHQGVMHLRDTQYNARSFEENQRDPTDIRYVWFDFQPAARVIHLIHALRFLRGSPSLSRAERVRIVQSLYEHAELLMWTERHFRPLQAGDNHQSVRGVALLYAAAFFQGRGRWRDFLREGQRVCNFHIAHDFAGDGSEIENSPSYHCFCTWHLRDAVRLAQRHGFKLRADAPARLGKAADFARALMEPDGYSASINDGYRVHLRPFLQTLPGGVGRGQTTPQAATFRKAGVAVYRDADRYLLLDASPFTGPMSHYHAGKLALTAWFQGLPFLVDSGCSSYEDPLYYRWYKTAQAHSSLLIDGQGDGERLADSLTWRYWATPTLGNWRIRKGDYQIITNEQSSAPAWSDVRWRRELVVQPNGPVLLHDDVRLSGQRRLTFGFNLHPDVRVKRTGDGYELTHRRTAVRIHWPSADHSTLHRSVQPGHCALDFRHRGNTRLLVEASAAGRFQLSTVIHPG